MLILFIGIITVVMFYHSAKKNGASGINWALTGLIGYIISVALAMMIIGETLISALIGCATVYLAHKMLLIKTNDTP